MAAKPVKRALIIAFHFPPVGFSSGVQRTLKLVQHMVRSDWQPLVVVPHPRAYPVRSNEQLPDVPAAAVVRPCFALDSVRHLGIGERYLRFTALPDRWITWWPGGVRAATRLIDEYQPDVMWSTFPIATAHLIALSVHERTGIPWVADFRDPMTKPDYPEDIAQRRSYARLERRVVKACTHAVFTTPGAMRAYTSRFAELPEARCSVIGNGYEEEDFPVHGEAGDAMLGGGQQGRPLTLLHSGHVYPRERDPTALLQAVATLVERGELGPDELRLVFRASGQPELIRNLAERHGVSALVAVEPPLPYREALTEMLEADGLLILQAASCNEQIPAKAYEYLRARRPILALTDAAGDTGALLREAGVPHVCPLDDAPAIADQLARFVADVRASRVPAPRSEFVAAHSRRALSARIVDLLDRVATQRLAAPVAPRVPER